MAGAKTPANEPTVEAISEDVMTHILAVLPDTATSVRRTEKKAEINLKITLGYRQDKDDKEKKRLYFTTQARFHKSTEAIEHECAIDTSGQLQFIGKGFEKKEAA